METLCTWGVNCECRHRLLSAGEPFKAALDVLLPWR